MKKKLYITFVLAMLLALSSISAVFAQDSSDVTLFQVEVRNRTDDSVSVTLVGKDVFAAYILSAPAGADRVFTVRKGSYNHTTISCGESATGTLEVSHQLRLVFTPCFKDAPNWGAPAIEKVHLTDSPGGLAWYYQYGPISQAAPGSSSGGGTVGSCTFSTDEEVTIYQRPSTEAVVFSVQGPGFTWPIHARTDDGWLGFEPGIAQAPNIGSFRLRWIEPGAGTLSGNCSNLRVVWGPPPGICFDMPFQNTPVRSEPDASSPSVFLLHNGEFAAVTGLLQGGGWARVDLGPGNTGSNAVGWVEADTLNMNGPCGELPTVSP